MRDRGMDWWDNHWARRDTLYSPAPYEQLTAALMALGDRDAANEIRYFGRVRNARQKKDWLTFGLAPFSMSPVSVLAPTPFEFSIGWSPSHTNRPRT
jgi:hypothetical protein